MDTLHTLYLKRNSPTFQIRKSKLKNIAYQKHLKQLNPEKKKSLETTVLTVIFFFFPGKTFVNYQSLKNKINGLSVTELSSYVVNLSFM